jgi:hypothetical protein
MSAPVSHVARTVAQVHDHVQLEVQRNRGNCDHREEVGSGQEMKDRTGKLCGSWTAARVLWAVLQLSGMC